MNAQPTTPATTEFITLENYSDKVWNGEIYGFSGTFLKSELEGYKALLESFLAGTTKPSKIIGTGFKNPRKYALEYLNERIAEYTKYVNREELHSITIANYFFKMSDYCVNKGVTVEQKEYFLNAYKQYKGKDFACEVKVLTPETKKPTAKVYRIFKANDRVKFAGTNEPSFFNIIESAVEKCDFDKGEKIYEYCTKYHAKLWEVCVDKNYKTPTNEPTNQPETMQATTPQPETLSVGQVIQGENCRLVVTKVYKKLSTKRLEKAIAANGVIKTAKRNQKNNAIAKFSIGDSVKWEGNDKYTYTVKSIKRGVAKVFNGGSNIYVNINTLTKVAEPKKEEMTNEEKAIYDIVNGTNLSGVPKCEKKGNGSYFTFSNDSCFVSVDLESKEISGKCYKDHNNEPRFYNQTSKGIKKALLALQNGFDENTSMFEAARLCAPFVRCRRLGK